LTPLQRTVAAGVALTRLASLRAIRLGSASYPPIAQPIVSRMVRFTVRITSPGKSS
jgi:hypothetical protein